MSSSPTTDVVTSARSDPKGTNNDLSEYLNENKMDKMFPWQVKFNELCRSAVGSKSMKMLENLLTVYLQKGSVTIKDCYTKPIRATKLKKCMSDALVFFHLFYQDIKESFENSTYLEKMTELMSMYLDIELIASKRRREHARKVVCRLTSALYIFLDHSENHILDVIIRSQFIKAFYREICSPMLGKLLTTLRVYPMNDTLYVRYLLVFKLWKLVVGDAEERKNINKIAIQNLPAPSGFMDRYKRFNNVLPRVPASMSVTLFYMQAKFNLKAACKAFMKISKDPQQPIISDKPLFFEGRLASSQSTFSSKSNAFECGVSRNLMNDIWSIAEPVSKEKKSKGVNGKAQSSKKSKEKNNKATKKKTKDWFSDNKKKKNTKNVTLTFGNFRESNLTGDVAPPSSNLSNAKETAVAVSVTVATKPATIERLPTPEVAKTQEPADKSSLPVFTQNDALPETKPLLNLLTPQIQAVPPATCMTEVNTAMVDKKPSISSINLSTVGEVETLPPFQVEIPKIHLSPPEEDTPRVKEINGLCARTHQLHAKEGVDNSLLGTTEEGTLSLGLKNTFINDLAVVDTKEEAQVESENNLIEEVKSLKVSSEEIVPTIGLAEYLDHSQDNVILDVVNEVTIGTSELEIAEGESEEELPYLECQKEEVIESQDVASPEACIDIAASTLTCEKDDHVSGVEEVQSVIVPPMSSKGFARPNDNFVPSSQSVGTERLVVEHHAVVKDVVRCVVPTPPKVPAPSCVPAPEFIQPAERSVVMDLRQDVKSEVNLPPEEVAFTKEAPRAMLDDEMLQQSGDWFGLFAGSGSTDLLFDCMDVPSGYELESTSDPRVVNPHMLEVGREPARTVAAPCLPPGDFQQYSRMYTEAAMHRNRLESTHPPREFLAEDYPHFNSVPDGYSYYNARDLYGNYNPNIFFDDSVNQPPPREGSSQKQAPSTIVRSEASPFNTVDYNSSNSHSSNNSILTVRDKDSLNRQSGGLRVPVNGDDNYYRATGSNKTQEEQVLRKIEEPVDNANPSNMKASTSSSVSGEDKHLLQKRVTSSTSTHRKTPHPMVTQQDNRRNVGYSAQVQLTNVRHEEVPPKPAVRGGATPHVPNFNPAGLNVRADELKHRDDELLKNIENSMKDQPATDGSAQFESETTELDGRFLAESHSSLPPKKRHKLSSDLLTQPGPTCPESFPSFGVRPMMNILELGEEGTSPEMYMYKSLQSVTSNNPRSMQEGVTSRTTRANPRKRADSPSIVGQNWYKHDAFFGDGGCDFGPCDFELDICDVEVQEAGETNTNASNAPQDIGNRNDPIGGGKGPETKNVGLDAHSENGDTVTNTPPDVSSPKDNGTVDGGKEFPIKNDNLGDQSENDGVTKTVGSRRNSRRGVGRGRVQQVRTVKQIKLDAHNEDGQAMTKASQQNSCNNRLGRGRGPRLTKVKLDAHSKNGQAQPTRGVRKNSGIKSDRVGRGRGRLIKKVELDPLNKTGFHTDKKLKMDTNKRPVTRSISKETMLTLNSSMPITSRRKSKKPR